MHDFIRSCIRSRRRPLDLSDPRIDWMRVFREVNDDFAAPPLWSAIVQAGLDTGAPQDVRDYLAFLHVENARCNGQLREQCLAIGRVLSEHGFDAILLKGATWLFEDGPARKDRMMRDLDILLRHEDSEGAREALLDAGYRIAETILAEVGNIHELPLIREGEPASVELHVELSTRLPMLPAAEVWAESLPVAPGLRMPSPRHRIVHNVIHAQITNGDYAGGVVSLRDSLDLARLTLAHSDVLDWRGMADLARTRGYFRQLSGALHKASRFAGGALAAPFAGDFSGRLHARRCALQRVFPVLDKPLRKLGILRRALAWERDSYVLRLGDDRSLAAHLKVNRRRATRTLQALRRGAGKD